MRSPVLLLLLLFTISSINAQSWWSDDHNESKAFLGVNTDELDRSKEKLLELPDYGTLITSVIPGTAAEKAGLQAFDYIIGVGEKDMSWNNDLTDLLRQHSPGDEVSIRYIRQGEVQETMARLTDRASVNRWSGKHSDAFLGVKEHDSSLDSRMGVKVRTVCNSSAEQLGLQNGDVIMAINGQPIVDWQDISIALNQMSAGDPITIDYTRNDQPNRASGSVGSEDREDCSNTRGYLGVYTGHMSRDKADKLDLPTPYGSYLKKIIPGSGADEAGLQPLDYILSINDSELDEDRSLTHILRRYSPGQVVTVEYMRQGQRRSAEVTLQGPSDDGLSRPCAEEPFFGVSTNHNPNRRNGVAVNIVKNSAAQAAGLRSGDIITNMNGNKVVDWSDISAIINGSDVGQQMNISYIRNGQEGSATATMGAECDGRGESRNENNWYDYNHDSSFRNNSQAEDEPAVDMDRIQVSMDDMDDAEIAEMANRGIDMPTVNNLSIEAVNLFPNPTRGMFRLEFELPERGETFIRVFNAEGRLIYSFDLGDYQGTFSDDIDISQNGPGAYFLEIRQGNTSMTKKILLQY